MYMEITNRTDNSSFLKIKAVYVEQIVPKEIQKITGGYFGTK